MILEGIGVCIGVKKKNLQSGAKLRTQDTMTTAYCGARQKMGGRLLPVVRNVAQTRYTTVVYTVATSGGSALRRLKSDVNVNVMTEGEGG